MRRRNGQAAFESDVGSGSGAGPQTYTLNAGGGSSREPREITIPSGSSAARIRLVLAIRHLDVMSAPERSGRALMPTGAYPSSTTRAVSFPFHNSLSINDFQMQNNTGGLPGVALRHVVNRRIRVVSRRQATAFRARKVSRSSSWSSTVHPRYRCRSSSTDSARLPATKVCTRCTPPSAVAF